MATGTTYKWLDKLHEQYGPVVRMSPGELTTISPGAWKDIYLTKPQLMKDPYSQLQPMNGGHSLFTAHGPTHHRIRKTYAHAFSEKALREQAPLIESHISLFIQQLRREAAKADDKTVELVKFYGYVGLDVTADLTFGESFRSLEGDNEHSWVNNFFLGAKFGSVRNSLSHYYPFDVLFGQIFLRLTEKHRKRNFAFTRELMEKRLALGDLGIKRSDFMSAVVGNVNESGEKGITQTELWTNSLAILIAGCQLPMVLLATATYLLLKNASTYEIMRKEVRESFSREEEITAATAQSLPYLAAVIDETIRIHHPTPIHLPRVIPKGGQMVDGMWIPGNVRGLFPSPGFEIFSEELLLIITRL